jgi:hypothetical protein
MTPDAHEPATGDENQFRDLTSLILDALSWAPQDDPVAKDIRRIVADRASFRTPYEHIAALKAFLDVALKFAPEDLRYALILRRNALLPLTSDPHIGSVPGQVSGEENLAYTTSTPTPTPDTTKVPLFTLRADGEEHFRHGTFAACLDLITHWGPGHYEIIPYNEPTTEDLDD